MQMISSELDRDIATNILPARNIVSGVAPIEIEDPGFMALEIEDQFSGGYVVCRYQHGVTCCCQ